MYFDIVNDVLQSDLETDKFRYWDNILIGLVPLLPQNGHQSLHVTCIEYTVPLVAPLKFRNG